MQVPNGTGPGVRRSTRPLSACYTRCKCSIKSSHRSIKGRVRYKGHELVKQLLHESSSLQCVTKKKTIIPFTNKYMVHFILSSSLSNSPILNGQMFRHFCHPIKKLLMPRSHIHKFLMRFKNYRT